MLKNSKIIKRNEIWERASLLYFIYEMANFLKEVCRLLQSDVGRRGPCWIASRFYGKWGGGIIRK